MSSTQATFNDAEQIKEALTRLRSPTAPVEAYVLLHHHEGNANIVALQQEGEGIADLANRLDDVQVQYAIIRIQEQLDITTAFKFVYIHWIGEKVPFNKKGRYGVVHGSVKDQLATSCHVDIETSSIDDISTDNVNKLINETSGTRSKVIENSEAENRPMRGFTSVPTSRPPVKSKANLVPVSKGGAEVTHGADVTEAILEVRSDDSSTCWVCIGYEGNDVKKPLTCISKGSSDLEELKSCLEDDRPSYFLYRTTDNIDGHVTVKFVYIIWVGELVKPMAKAKLSTHKGDVQDIFSGCHVTIFATRKSEISSAIVADKVQSASGTKSHVK